VADIALYCPHCAERIHRKALSLAFDELIDCASCPAHVRAAQLLTDDGKTLVDYLALLTLKAASKKPATSLSSSSSRPSKK
jgi:hypothetical protein